LIWVSRLINESQYSPDQALLSSAEAGLRVPGKLTPFFGIYLEYCGDNSVLSVDFFDQVQDNGRNEYIVPFHSGKGEA
jgi:hypothetical protein